ncbi:MAG: hypothetical protein JSR34_09185 [Proteobacteria bacterium]|nr:hypothetical protein [Pseudomonadota bacterium]
MNAFPTRKRPASTGRGFRSSDFNYSKPTTSRTPSNWRERLPSPRDYYAARIEKLSRPNAAGWAQGRCPFHEDHDASLSVNLTAARGAWRCFAGCGAGDLVSFHERLRGLGFVEAVRDLVGVR